jgi:hypothetical protein|tara:strand:+ start:2592 stop:2780 length:189 start_codon:yes stop_codon:yes gene_type:complete
MAKIYKLKEKTMPRQPSFLGLDPSDWYELNARNEVELKKLPELVKDYVEEVKKIQIKSKEVK